MKRKYNYGRSAACWVCSVFVLGSGCVFESIGNGLSAGLRSVASCVVPILVEEALDLPDDTFNEMCGVMPDDDDAG